MAEYRGAHSHRSGFNFMIFGPVRLAQFNQDDAMETQFLTQFPCVSL